MKSTEKQYVGSRKAREREARAHNASIRIFELRKKVKEKTAQETWTLGTTKSLLSMIKEIAEKERLLIGWGYDVDDSVRAAAEYVEYLAKEDQDPKPVRKEGASAYGKGTKMRRWT
jgi:hypothetical protein